jgi:hypothetical protein
MKILIFLIILFSIVLLLIGNYLIKMHDQDYHDVQFINKLYKSEIKKRTADAKRKYRILKRNEKHNINKNLMS